MAAPIAQLHNRSLVSILTLVLLLVVFSSCTTYCDGCAMGACCHPLVQSTKSPAASRATTAAILFPQQQLLYPRWFVKASSVLLGKGKGLLTTATRSHKPLLIFAVGTVLVLDRVLTATSHNSGPLPMFTPPPDDAAAAPNEDNKETPKERLKQGGAEKGQQGVKKDTVEGNDTNGNTEDAGTMSTAMIASIGFYKKIISPLLPPACRFLPTCSQYGVQAIQEFGPTKGAVLTAWRLARCTPLGGRGYDPPKWPPVSYTYSSY